MKSFQLLCITSLTPMKNDFEISCAEEDGAVGGALEQTPNVTIRTAIIAGILNRMSWKNMADFLDVRTASLSSSFASLSELLHYYLSNFGSWQ